MNEESIWDQREEVVYPERFGTTCHGIFPLTKADFRPFSTESTIQAHWLQCGVFEFEPTAARPSWLYVSSGTSNPGWIRQSTPDSGADYSGLGTELVVETKDQAAWANELLKQLLVHNILAAAELRDEEVPLDYWHRRPLPGTIEELGNGPLRHVLITVPEHYESSFALPSGQVDLLHVVGITNAEKAFADQHGADQLMLQLAGAGAYPQTDPARQCTCTK